MANYERTTKGKIKRGIHWYPSDFDVQFTSQSSSWHVQVADRQLYGYDSDLLLILEYPSRLIS